MLSICISCNKTRGWYPRISKIKISKPIISIISSMGTRLNKWISIPRVERAEDGGFFSISSKHCINNKFNSLSCYKVNTIFCNCILTRKSCTALKFKITICSTFSCYCISPVWILACFWKRWFCRLSSPSFNLITVCNTKIRRSINMRTPDFCKIYSTTYSSIHINIISRRGSIPRPNRLKSSTQAYWRC